jgi:hypothetical protein
VENEIERDNEIWLWESMKYNESIGATLVGRLGRYVRAVSAFLTRSPFVDSWDKHGATVQLR